MKKIALLHYAYPPKFGGVEIVLQEHAHILSKLGFEVSIITGSGKENNKLIKLIEIKEIQSILRFNKRLYEKIIEKQIIDKDFYKLSSLIEKKLEENLQNINCIIVHNMLTLHYNPPFILAFKNYVKRHPEKKIIVWVHDHAYIAKDKLCFEKFHFHSLIHKLLTEKFNKVKYIAISSTFKKLLPKVMNLPEKEIDVIYNGINLKSFLEIDDNIWNVLLKRDILNYFPIILSPVNIIERKNIEYCLEIIRFLKQNYPNIMYIITGKTAKHKKNLGYINSLHRIIKKYSLENNVLFSAEVLKKFLPCPELHDLYDISDMIFYFSKSENFGLPVIESLATKTPIFTSDLNVFHEIGKDYINYIDCKAISPKKASEIIRQYIETCKTMKGNFHVRKNYNLEYIIKKQLVPLIK